MNVEVKSMTTIYVDPSKKKEQVVQLSDGSQGLMYAKKQKGGTAYEFKFTAHLHPSFLITHVPVDGDVENVDTIDGKQSFKIALR
jgi:hypothetical protein